MYINLQTGGTRSGVLDSDILGQGENGPFRFDDATLQHQENCPEIMGPFVQVGNPRLPIYSELGLKMPQELIWLWFSRNIRLDTT